MDNDKPQYRNFTIFGILTCGIVSIALGIYMNANNLVAVGILSRSRNINTLAGSSTGIGAILLGLIISAFPIYALLKGQVKK